MKSTSNTHMRTNIEIDDKLMRDALRATGAKTKREVVDVGLRILGSTASPGKDARAARQSPGRVISEADAPPHRHHPPHRAVLVQRGVVVRAARSHAAAG